MIDFLYDPIKGNCVAWMLDGDVFAESDRKIATTDREGNIYTLDGELIGHLEGADVVPKGVWVCQMRWPSYCGKRGRNSEQREPDRV